MCLLCRSMCWARIYKRLKNSGINSQPGRPIRQVGLVPTRQTGNRFLGSLKGLQIRAQKYFLIRSCDGRDMAHSSNKVSLWGRHSSIGNLYPCTQLMFHILYSTTSRCTYIWLLFVYITCLHLYVNSLSWNQWLAKLPTLSISASNKGSETWIKIIWKSVWVKV